MVREEKEKGENPIQQEVEYIDFPNENGGGQGKASISIYSIYKLISLIVFIHLLLGQNVLNSLYYRKCTKTFFMILIEINYSFNLKNYVNYVKYPKLR